MSSSAARRILGCQHHPPMLRHCSAVTVQHRLPNCNCARGHSNLPLQTVVCPTVSAPQRCRSTTIALLVCCSRPSVSEPRLAPLMAAINGSALRLLLLQASVAQHSMPLSPAHISASTCMVLSATRSVCSAPRQRKCFRALSPSSCIWLSVVHARCCSGLRATSTQPRYILPASVCADASYEHCP